MSGKKYVWDYVADKAVLEFRNAFRKRQAQGQRKAIPTGDDKASYVARGKMALLWLIFLCIVGYVIHRWGVKMEATPCGLVALPSSSAEAF